MKTIYEIVGMKWRKMESFVASMPEGEPIELHRDAGNEHDPNAVKVLMRGKFVGFVKATEAVSLARMMDRHDQAMITARLVTVGRAPHAEVA
jgi:hypothetical protein